MISQLVRRAFCATNREIDKLRAEIKNLEGLVYVPGAWRCAKCQLRIMSSNMNLFGTITANNAPQKCPNGCGPMWRITEREDRKDAQRHFNELSDRTVGQKLESPDEK